MVDVTVHAADVVTRSWRCSAEWNSPAVFSFWLTAATQTYERKRLKLGHFKFFMVSRKVWQGLIHSSEKNLHFVGAQLMQQMNGWNRNNSVTGAAFVHSWKDSLSVCDRSSQEADCTSLESKGEQQLLQPDRSLNVHSFYSKLFCFSLKMHWTHTERDPLFAIQFYIAFSSY